MDGGANQVPTYLGQLLHLLSPWVFYVFTFNFLVFVARRSTSFGFSFDDDLHISTGLFSSGAMALVTTCFYIPILHSFRDKGIRFENEPRIDYLYLYN